MCSLSPTAAQFSALHRKLEGVALKGESEKNVNERVKIEFDDMLSALREVRPSAMREVTLEVPKVSEDCLSSL